MINQLQTVIQKILQDINTCYKNSREMYFDELISESKNTTKTIWKIIKKKNYYYLIRLKNTAH